MIDLIPLKAGHHLLARRDCRPKLRNLTYWLTAPVAAPQTFFFSHLAPSSIMTFPNFSARSLIVSTKLDLEIWILRIFGINNFWNIWKTRWIGSSFRIFGKWVMIKSHLIFELFENRSLHLWKIIALNFFDIWKIIESSLELLKMIFTILKNGLWIFKKILNTSRCRLFVKYWIKNIF